MVMHWWRCRIFSWLLLALIFMQLIACGKLKNNASAITSGNNATFTVGTAGSFTVTATGHPTPTFSLSAATGGTVPAWLTLDPKSGILSGTPPTGSANTYALVITASNGIPPDATQNFTLTVNSVSTSVLIVHDGTMSTTEADMVTGLSSIVQSPNVGFSSSQSVDVTTTPSLNSYKEIWDVRFSTSLSSGEIASYTTYVQNGGTLVMIGGDPINSPTRNNSIINLISTLGGGSIISPITANNPQTVLSPFTGTGTNMAVSSVSFSSATGTSSPPGLGAFITISGTTGTAIFFDKSRLINAPAGRMMVVFDFNFLLPTSSADLQNLTANMLIQ